jgi:hypothetical protein
MINEFGKGIKVAGFPLSISIPARSKQIMNIAASTVRSLTKVFSLLVVVSLLHGCASGPPPASQGQTVGLMTGKGIANVFSMDGWTADFSKAQESAGSGPSTEVQGTLFGMIVSGSISLALTDGIQTWALVGSRNCQLVVPPTDTPGPGKFIVRSGTYLVRGFTEKVVQSPRGTIPLLRVQYLEKLK